MTHLRSLMIQGTRVTGAGLAELKYLLHLQVLGLSADQLTRESVEHVKAMPQLQELDFEDDFTDEHLEILKQLPQLKTLDLSRLEPNLQGLKQFEKALPNCRVILNDSDQ
jgi:hypothetical protein